MHQRAKSWVAAVLSSADSDEKPERCVSTPPLHFLRAQTSSPLLPEKKLTHSTSCLEFESEKRKRSSDDFENIFETIVKQNDEQKVQREIDSLFEQSDSLISEKKSPSDKEMWMQEAAYLIGQVRGDKSPDSKHQCIDPRSGLLQCTYVNASGDKATGDVFCCTTSGKIHLCTMTTCTKQRACEGRMICCITGRQYGAVFSQHDVKDIRSRSEVNTYGGELLARTDTTLDEQLSKLSYRTRENLDDHLFSSSKAKKHCVREESSEKQGVLVVLQTRDMYFSLQYIFEGFGKLVGYLQAVYRVLYAEKDAQKQLHAATASYFCAPGDCLDSSEISLNSTSTMFVFTPVQHGGAMDEHEMLLLTSHLFDYVCSVEFGRQQEIYHGLRAQIPVYDVSKKEILFEDQKKRQHKPLRPGGSKGRSSSKKLSNTYFVQQIHDLFCFLNVDLSQLYGPAEDKEELDGTSFAFNVSRIKCLLHNRNHFSLIHDEREKTVFLRDIFRIYERGCGVQAKKWWHEVCENGEKFFELLNPPDLRAIERMNSVRSANFEWRFEEARAIIVDCLKQSRRYHLQKLLAQNVHDEAFSKIRKLARTRSVFECWTHYMEPWLRRVEQLKKCEIYWIDYLLEDIEHNLEPMIDFIIDSWEKLCLSPNYLVQSTHKSSANFKKHCLAALYKMSEGLQLQVLLSEKKLTKAGVPERLIRETRRDICLIPKNLILERCLVHLTTLGNMQVQSEISSHSVMIATTTAQIFELDKSVSKVPQRVENGTKQPMFVHHSPSKSPFSSSGHSLREGSRRHRTQRRRAEHFAQIDAHDAQGGTRNTLQKMSSPNSAKFSLLDTQKSDKLKTTPVIQADILHDGDVSKKFCRSACSMITRAYKSELDCAVEVFYKTCAHFFAEYSLLQKQVQQQQVKQVEDQKDALEGIEMYAEEKFRLLLASLWTHVRNLEHPWAELEKRQ